MDSNGWTFLEIGQPGGTRINEGWRTQTKMYISWLDGPSNFNKCKIQKRFEFILNPGHVRLFYAMQTHRFSNNTLINLFLK
jgi:hypothetical protein